MGLPLFRAPVEPEVCAHIAIDKSSARARSTIRRQRTVRGPNSRPRESRREGPGATEISIIPSERLLSLDQALAASIRRAQNDEGQSDTPGPDPVVSGIRRSVPLSSLPRLERQSSLHIIEPPTSHNPDSRHANMVRFYASRSTHRGPGLEPQPSGPTTAIGPSTAAPSPPLESPAAPLLMDTFLSAVSRSSSGANSPWANEDGQRPHVLPPLRRWDRNSPAWRRAQRRRTIGREGPNVDGLGDRNRSPSWEGDGAWDTLLTTLTPDPQPPSANSSFGSTSASTSATTNVDSSGTSLTSFNEDFVLENPCDIVEAILEGFSDLSDSEDENEDEANQSNDRSYADVVSSRRPVPASTGGAEVSESLGGMQRIIRRLAGREDIPDEWWAEVGLSRSLRRDETV